MEITLNSSLGSVTLSDNTNFHIMRPVVGLETAPERTTYGNYSGTSGGYVSAQFYGVRDFSITGFIKSSSASAHTADRQQLISSVPIAEDIEITILTFSGEEYYLQAHRSRLNMDLIAECHSEFKIDFISSDNFIYDINELSVTIAKFTGGGAILPWILPVIFGAGTGVQTVTNSGANTVYPRITLTGSAQNPRLTNLTTDEFVEVTINMSGSDELVIDMKQRTISLNDTNILAYRVDGSSWWGLEPGNNQIMLETDSGGDTGSALMAWRPAYEGI